MLTPVACFTCGCSIGHVAQLYRKIRRERVRKALTRHQKTLPQQAAMNMEMDMEMGDVLTKLGIPNDCCRTHLSTAMVYSDYY